MEETVIRDFVNSKGSRYTKVGVDGKATGVAAQFKDMWVCLRIHDGMWVAAFLTVATGKTIQFFIGSEDDSKIPPVVAYHVAMGIYRNTELGEKDTRGQFVTLTPATTTRH